MSATAAAAWDAPALLLQEAEEVLHRPGGDALLETSVAAVVQESDPIVQFDGGLGVQRRARLAVAATITVTPRDRWRIGEEWWETERIVRPIGGLVEVLIVRHEREIASGGGPRVL